MKSPLLRTGTILLIALVGGLVVLAGLAYFAQSLTKYGKRPIDFLPADQTVAYIQSPAQELLKRFAFESNVSDGSDAVALLRMEDGSLNAATFWDKRRVSPEIASLEGVVDAGTFFVVLADPYDNFSDAKTELLSSSEYFNTLMKHKDRDETVAFLSVDILPELSDLPSQILKTYLLKTNSYLTYSPIGNHTVIELIGGAIPTSDTLPTPEIAAPQSAILTLAVASPQLTWQRLQEFPITHRQIITSLMQQEVIDRLGEEISLEYDLLESLGPTLFSVLEKRDGKHAFFLSGRAKTHRELSALIEKLHASVKGGFPAMQIEERTLDDRFTSKDIRFDDSDLGESEDDRSGWTVQSTKYDGTGLYTARRGKEFVLTDSSSALEEYLEGESTTLALPVSPSLIRSSLLAGGWVRQPEVSELLKKTVKDFEIESSSPLLPDDSGTILWSMEQRGPVTTLNIAHQ